MMGLFLCLKFAGLAQLVEHSFCNRRVEGSSPSISTKYVSVFLMVKMRVSNTLRSGFES